MTGEDVTRERWRFVRRYVDEHGAIFEAYAGPGSPTLVLGLKDYERLGKPAVMTFGVEVAPAVVPELAPVSDRPPVNLARWHEESWGRGVSW